MKLILILSFIFTAPKALAWGDLGHATVAHIAQQYISPKTKAAVESILGIEFMGVAATWPDAVRSDSRYKDFAPYHFIEIPMGETVNNLSHRPAKDALTVLEKFPAIIKDPKASPYKKRIALSYIIHVVGDIHQPLHVGNGLDFGANICNIRWEDAKTGKLASTNLHSFWDDKLVDQIAEMEKEGKKFGWFDYTSFAPLIIKRFQSDSEFTADVSTDPKLWITQSQELRVNEVYPDANPTAAKDRLYCSIGARKVDPADIPVLSKMYIDRMIPLAEKQIMRGGKRLAAFLETIFQDYPESVSDKEVLDSLNIVN